MTTRGFHFILRRFSWLAPAVVAASVAGCTGGQSGISVSSNGSNSSGGSGALGSITLSSFKQHLGSGYAVVGYSAQDQILNVSFGASVSTTSSSNMQADGSCTRGVSNIVVRAKKTAGAGSGATTHDLVSDLKCSADTFSWTPSAGIEVPFAVAAEGTWELKFIPVDAFGTEHEDLGGVVNLTIDFTAPPVASAPKIDSNSCPGAVWTTCVSPYVAQTSTPVIDMTVDSATYKVRMTGGTAALDNENFTDAAASFTATLSAGDTTTYTFQTYDELGNTSGDLQLTISYTAPLAASPGNFLFTSMTIGASSVTSGSYSAERALAEEHSSDPTPSTGDTSYTGQVGKVPYLIGL